MLSGEIERNIAMLKADAESAMQISYKMGIEEESGSGVFINSHAIYRMMEQHLKQIEDLENTVSMLRKEMRHNAEIVRLRSNFEEIGDKIRTVMSDAGSIRLLMEDFTEIDYDKIHAVDALADHQKGCLEHLSDEISIIERALEGGGYAWQTQ